jgi:hypothetical protein
VQPWAFPIYNLSHNFRSFVILPVLLVPSTSHFFPLLHSIIFVIFLLFCFCYWMKFSDSLFLQVGVEVF